MKRAAWIVVLVLVGVAAGGVFLFRVRPPAVATGARYQCAMHPEIVSDRPGICPICQMKLQRVEERKPLFYRHPMRPDVTSPTPRKDEMGMDYVPVYAGDVEAKGESAVPGHAPFTLSTERQQLIGVTTERVARRPLARTIRMVGKVAYDPELYQAIVEYREALRARSDVQQSHWHDARRGADAIVRGAMLRLRQRGLSDEQIRAIRQDGADPTELLLPGKSVWVYAQLWEDQSGLVRAGQEATVTATSAPGRTWTGQVVAIDPILTAATRTARVRILLPTPLADLRPEAFVDATVRVPLGDVLAVPDGAIVDTGAHRIAFVVRGEGRFEPRSVELGRRGEGFSEVLSGVAEGEAVVTSANFLIDSESRFRAALAAFSR
jgi:Cu(I)/Ag(I) efflux system membrane fusion protein